MSATSPTLPWSRTCYGVDLQGDRLAVVRAERAGNRVVCSEVTDAAGRIGSEGPVAASLSVRESFSRWIEAPFPSPGKARRVLPTLLDIQLPFALETCVYAFLAVERTPEGRCRGLAVAARQAAVEASLTAWAGHGLDPQVLDQDGLALWSQALRECPSAGAEPDALRVVFYAGLDSGTVVIGRGADFISAHPVRLDDADQLRRLVQAPAAGPRDEEGGEAGAPLEWILCGPGAATSGAARVTAIEPAAALHTVEDPDRFLARAVATRALLGGPYACNLRSGSLVHADVAGRRRRRGRQAVAAALAAGVLLCVLNAAALWVTGRRVAEAESIVSRTIDAVAGYEVSARGHRGHHALQAVKDAVAARQADLAAFHAALQPGVDVLLRDAGALAAAEGLHLEAVLLAAERIELSGTAPDWKRCERLVPLLEARGFQTRTVRSDALANERIPFTITGEPTHD